MSGRFWLPGLFALVVTIAAAATTAHDLGNGLTYLRVRHLEDPLPPIPGPVVLDLRYAGGETLSAGLAERLRQEGPLRMVLHDATPAPALVEVLAGRARNVLTVAPEGASPPAQFEVAVEPAEDRAAYDAHERGAEVATLIRTEANKQRHDEAALIRAQNGPLANPGPPNEAAAPTPVAVAPTDRVLLRAVQLARGLQALGLAD